MRGQVVPGYPYWRENDGGDVFVLYSFVLVCRGQAKLYAHLQDNEGERRHAVQYAHRLVEHCVGAEVGFGANVA